VPGKLEGFLERASREDEDPNGSDLGEGGAPQFGKARKKGDLFRKNTLEYEKKKTVKKAFWGGKILRTSIRSAKRACRMRN